MAKKPLITGEDLPPPYRDEIFDGENIVVNVPHLEARLSTGHDRDADDVSSALLGQESRDVDNTPQRASIPSGATAATRSKSLPKPRRSARTLSNKSLTEIKPSTTAEYSEPVETAPDPPAVLDQEDSVQQDINQSHQSQQHPGQKHFGSKHKANSALSLGNPAGISQKNPEAQQTKLLEATTEGRNANLATETDKHNTQRVHDSEENRLTYTEAEKRKFRTLKAIDRINKAIDGLATIRDRLEGPEHVENLPRLISEVMNWTLIDSQNGETLSLDKGLGY